MEDVQFVPTFIYFLDVDIQLFQDHLLKRLSFSIELPLPLFWSFLGFLFCPSDLLECSFTNYSTVLMTVAF